MELKKNDLIITSKRNKKMNEGKYPQIPSIITKETWENVYKPDVDTYLLMDVLTKDQEFIKKRQPLLSLEIGCGSGIVSEHLHQLFPRIETFCSDINPYALNCTKKIHPTGNLLKSSLIESIRDMSIDLFIYNPPYVPTPPEEMTQSYIAMSWAGGKDGREKIDCVIERLWDILSPTGIAYMVLIHDDNPSEIMKLALQNALIPKIMDSITLQTEKLYIMRFTPMSETN